MNIFEFASGSPFLAFFLAIIIGDCIRIVYSRTMRHLNIRKHGWPPAHCDADGDFKEEPEKQE